MTDNNAKILNRVRGLLAKAEDPACTPEEATLFSAKAEELVAKYALDAAMLSQEDKGKPIMRRYPISNPYGRPKTALFQGIAVAYGCAPVRDTRTKEDVIVGFAADLDVVEILFASILVQGNHQFFRGPSDKSWRTSFWYGFANRAVQRVEESRRKAKNETPGAALVLFDRSKETKDALRDMFGGTRASGGGRATSAAGLGAGRAAADRSDIGTQRFAGGHKAIA
jgi:hypothetical protein